MSYPKGQLFINPYVFFLVNDGLSSIFDDIKAGRKTDALVKLYWFIGFLEPKIQDELKEQIKMIEDIFDDVDLLTHERFRSILWNVIGKLHNEGYFISAKMPKEVLVGYEKGRKDLVERGT